MYGTWKLYITGHRTFAISKDTVLVGGERDIVILSIYCGVARSYKAEGKKTTN